MFKYLIIPVCNNTFACSSLRNSFLLGNRRGFAAVVHSQLLYNYDTPVGNNSLLTPPLMYREMKYVTELMPGTGIRPLALAALVKFLTWNNYLRSLNNVFNVKFMHVSLKV